MALRTTTVKILQICTNDRILQSAHRLRREFARLGHEAVMFLGERLGEGDPAALLFRPRQDPVGRVRRYVRARRIERGLAGYPRSQQARRSGFSDDRSPHGSDALAQLPDADVISVDAMHRLLDFQAFFRTVPKRTPVVRVLHDMSFFTGGCHLDAGCGRFAEGCGACPQLGSADLRDISRRSWLRKSAALAEVDPGRLFIVAPSRWLAEAAKRSPLLRRFSVTVIPHGVDTEIFRPLDRRLARDVLGVDQQARVVLFVAEGIQRPVKRFAHLVEALEGFPGTAAPLLLTAGSGAPEAPVPVPHKHLGPIRDERMLALVYSAADLLVVSSQQESFSLVTLESLACGVPVVAAAVGGVREIVSDGTTGLLVPPNDVGALRDAIDQIVRDPERREQMARECRRTVLETYSIRVMAERYVALYDRIRTSPRPAAAQPSPRAPREPQTANTATGSAERPA